MVYEYDAANRKVAIVRGETNRTEFLYDGLGRRIQIVEMTNGVAVSTNRYVWYGAELCEERNATGNTVTKRFFGQGQINYQPSTIDLFYTRDHLGSVREMTDGTGAVRARYEYDPYGRRTKGSGDLDADFGFTGHFVIASLPDHTLTLYRLYRPDLGRWTTRDPIVENGGLNLYEYAGNNPVNSSDPLGLEQIDWHHIFVQQLRDLFKEAGIDIDDAKNGLMLPRSIHNDLHALGYNEKWAEFFGDGTVKREAAEIHAFAKKLAGSELFKEYFDLGAPAVRNFRQWTGPASKALAALGAVAALAAVSASAENIGCYMKDFVDDNKAGKNDWAYVDALMVRQELNQNGFFAGDIAMSAMLKGSE